MALTIDQLNIQITANSNKATRALSSLIQKLEQLKASLNGTTVSNITISNSFNKTTNSVNKTDTAVKKADSSVKKYNKTSDTASKSTASFTDKLAMNISKWRTLFGVFQSAANVMASWFNESNDYIETLNLFNVTMGDAADQASDFAEKVQDLMGIDIAEWMEYQGKFKQLSSGFGVASESANIMSQNLTQLSYDMASFFNTDVETAFDKLSSAMAGQVKGLREFGIDVTVASLQEYALSKGIEKTVRSMSQGEKALLRYNYIMEKSINMQGDMARTIITPANALRILDAQLTQLKRALGNIVSALVVNVIPYVQAFVQLITEAAQKLALFFGFKIQEIDYSGLGSGFVDETEDAEESLEGASDTLKKIKKQLMGFDEINLLSNPDADSAAGGAGGGGGVLDVEPLEYDFLKGLDTGKAEEIYNTIKRMLSPLKKIWNYLDDYEDTITTVLGILATFGIIKWLKNIKTAILGTKLSEYFLAGFSSIKAAGGTFFQSMKGGFDGIRNSLTGIQKAAIVAVAGIIELVAVKDSVKALALGCEDVGAKIVTIGVVVAAAATAMYVALGPAGLALAAVVAFSGAIWGVTEANEELRKKMVEEAFYNGVGTDIAELGNAFALLTETITSTNQPILDNKEKIETAKKSIDDTAKSIETLSWKYEHDLIPKEEYITAVTDAFSGLSDNVKIVMDAIYENVMYALSTSLGEAVTAAGGSVDEYLKLLGKIKQDGDTLYSQLVEDQKSLTEQFDNGDISGEEYARRLAEISEKMKSLTGETSAVEEFTNKVTGLKDALNWGEDEGARKELFTSIQDNAVGAKTSINDSCDEIKKNLETMKLWTTDSEAILAIDQLLLGNEESRKNQLAEVDKAVNDVYTQLQNDLIAKTNDVADAAKKEWDSMGGWARFWSGSSTESEYVREAIKTYQEDFVDPISSEIQDSIKRLGTKGETWASDAMTGIIKEAFVYTPQKDSMPIYAYSKDLSEAVKSAMREVDLESSMKTLGVDAISGYVSGIDSKTGTLTKKVTESINAGLKFAQIAQDSHSPSKEYKKLGVDAIDGYVEGVEEGFPDISKAFTDGFKTVFDGITKQASSIFSVDKWTGYARNITTALSNIKMPKLSNIGLSVTLDTWVSSDKEKIYKALGLSGWPRLSWYTYAQGGFPTMGEMFIAREAGPELVGSIGKKTAVANNDQIVEGIYHGVYSAMMAANNGKNGGNITVNATLEMDGEVVGRKVIKYHNGVVMQTGESPLLV